MDRFPYLYQKFIKTSFELKVEDKNYRLRIEKSREKAREFIDKEGLDYLIMGHTHEPVGDDNKLFDCGDMIDSLIHVVIEDGKPRLEQMP